MALPNPIDYFAIQNVISRYCVALDTKDFAILQDVFTENVQAKYPFAEMTNVKDVAATIEKRLTHITSQHALTTQTIEIAEDGKTAKAMTYFSGAHFGTGKWQDQLYSVWGRYTDELILEGGKASLPGASGRWLINSRVVGFMGRLGNDDLMKGD